MEHSFVPPPEYEFPVQVIGGVARRFQHKWLKKFNGLVYSESANGGFCKYCFVFGRCGSTTSELGALVNRPLINFKKCEKLVEHFNSKKFHKEAVKVAMMYIHGQKKEVLPIDQQLSSLRKKRVVENRLKLCSIVETLILCGRQGIALRGHRDDQTSVESNPLQLPASLLRGQGYDGAGAMSGHTKGAAARIVAKYPKALYTHCASTNLIFVW